MKTLLALVMGIGLALGIWSVLKYTYEQDQAYSRLVCTTVYGLDNNCHALADKGGN